MAQEVASTLEIIHCRLTHFFIFGSLVVDESREQLELKRRGEQGELLGLVLGRVPKEFLKEFFSVVATQIFFQFSSRSLGTWSDFTHIFSDGLVQPPTSLRFPSIHQFRGNPWGPRQGLGGKSRLAPLKVVVVCASLACHCMILASVHFSDPWPKKPCHLSQGGLHPWTLTLPESK